MGYHFMNSYYHTQTHSVSYKLLPISSLLPVVVSPGRTKPKLNNTSWPWFTCGGLGSFTASVFDYSMIVYLQTTLPAGSFQHPSGPDGVFWLQSSSSSGFLPYHHAQT